MRLWVKSRQKVVDGFLVECCLHLMPYALCRDQSSLCAGLGMGIR